MKNNKSNKLVSGYLIGGLLVLILVPSVIYFAAISMDRMIHVEIIHNIFIRRAVMIILLIVGSIFGVWSNIVQNIIGKGGPLQIGNLEISPKTQYLVVSGPYKYTRNPMLFGTFLIYLSLAIFINSLAAIVLVIGIFIFMLAVIVKKEEKRLVEDFGSQYEEYRKKVAVFFPWFNKK